MLCRRQVTVMTFTLDRLFGKSVTVSNSEMEIFISCQSREIAPQNSLEQLC